MAMNVEAEIRDLKRRVGEIEGSFGFLTQQLRSVHKDLLTFQAKTEQRFEAVDQKFAAVDVRFDKVDGRLDRLDSGIRKLREDMPGIVGDAMRAVVRPRNGKPRKP
jgi:predicted  nucleic acid-binding Zn-ribbon protein